MISKKAQLIIKNVRYLLVTNSEYVEHGNSNIKVVIEKIISDLNNAQASISSNTQNISSLSTALQNAITTLNTTIANGDNALNTKINDLKTQIEKALSDLNASISKSKIYINVKDYNVKGDGTTNDTSALNTIFTSFPDGVNLFFPKGTYIIGNLTIPNNIGITGDYPVFKPSTGTINFMIKPSANAIVEDIIIDCNNNNSGSCDGIVINGSNVTINNCTIKNSVYGSGIKATGFDDLIITNNNIKNMGSAGIQLDTVNRCLIEGNIIDTMGNFGVVFYSVGMSKECVINNNRIIGCNSSGINTTFKPNTIESAQTLLTISNNYIKGCKTHGVECRASKTTINNNTIYGCGEQSDNQGIVCQSNNLIVENNYVEACTGVGIDMGNCGAFQVNNNMVVGNGMMGIEINSCDFGSVSNNTVLYNNNINYNSAKHGGIHLHVTNSYEGWTGKTTHVAINGNILQSGNFQSFGLYVSADCDFINVVGNDFHSSGIDGEYMVESATSIFRNNITSCSAPSTYNVTSTWDLKLRDEGETVNISGTININNIDIGNAKKYVGKTYTFIFKSAVTFNPSTTDNCNILLNGGGQKTFNNGNVLCLMWNGSKWIELYSIV